MRITSYIDSTITPDELALLSWFRKLAPTEQLALKAKATQVREPIGPVALEELFQEYAEFLEKQSRARRTVAIYLADLVGFQRFLLRSELDLTEMGRTLVREYVKSLYDHGYARVSISRKLTVLKGFLKFLRQQQVLDIAQLPPPAMFRTKTPQRIPEFLSQGEANRLCEAPDGTTPYSVRDRAMLELLYAAGLRVSELVGLDVRDLDLRDRTALVRCGKGDKDRWARYGAPCRRALMKYLEQVRPGLAVGKDTAALFLNRYGQRLSKRSVEKSIQHYAHEAGIHRRVYPHILRHSMATHMLEGGADIPVVQHFLGHARPSTTQIYTNVTRLEAQRALNKFHPRARPQRPVDAGVE